VRGVGWVEGEVDGVGRVGLVWMMGLEKARNVKRRREKEKRKEKKKRRKNNGPG